MAAAKVTEPVLGAQHPKHHMIGMRQAPAAKGWADAQILIGAFQHFRGQGQLGHQDLLVPRNHSATSRKQPRGGASRPPKSLILLGYWLPSVYGNKHYKGV